MKKDYSVTSLAGALVWAAAVILRRFSLPDTGIIRLVLNVLPNFGAIWLIVGLTITFWPYLLKKEFPANRFYALVGVALALILLSELAHIVAFGASFDVWDLVASLVAGGWLAAVHALSRPAKTPVDSGVTAGE